MLFCDLENLSVTYLVNVFILDSTALCLRHIRVNAVPISLVAPTIKVFYKLKSESLFVICKKITLLHKYRNILLLIFICNIFYYLMKTFMYKTFQSYQSIFSASRIIIALASRNDRYR